MINPSILEQYEQVFLSAVEIQIILDLTEEGEERDTLIREFGAAAAQSEGLWRQLWLDPTPQNAEMN